MAGPSGTAIFYVFLIAPGFVAVATTISLAAIEREHSRFTLLVWSVVLSIIIDALTVFIYQSLVKPIRSFDEMYSLLFNPGIQVDYIFFVLALSLIIGTFGAGFLLLGIPDRARQLVQSRSDIVVNPRQPWTNFIRGTGWIRVKTSDNATYAGVVSEWSRANRQNELRIDDPHILTVTDDGKQDFEPADGESMLFLENDIDRVTMLTKDERASLREKIASFRSQDENEDAKSEQIGSEETSERKEIAADDDEREPENEPA